MSLPPALVAAPLSNPLSFGLFSAASVTDSAESRQIGGMVLEPTNTVTSGQWPVDGDTDGEKEGPRAEWPTFPGMIVWAADTVNAVGTTIEGARQRAEHALALKEEVETERFIAPRLADAEQAEETASGIEDQLGILEAELAQFGRPGVIHVNRRYLPEWKKFAVKQGQGYVTHGGHRLVFGAGYGELGSDVVGTGPVVVQRGPVQLSEATNVRQNEINAVAERVIAVGWESPAIRVPVAE